MIRDKSRFDAIMLQKQFGLPGVFCKNEIAALEGIDSPFCEIEQVSDGRCDDV